MKMNKSHFKAAIEYHMGNTTVPKALRETENKIERIIIDGAVKLAKDLDRKNMVKR